MRNLFRNLAGILLFVALTGMATLLRFEYLQSTSDPDEVHFIRWASEQTLEWIVVVTAALSMIIWFFVRGSRWLFWLILSVIIGAGSYFYFIA